MKDPLPIPIPALGGSWRQVILTPFQFISACVAILTDRRYFSLSIVPVLIGIASFFVSSYLFYHYRQELSLQLGVHTSGVLFYLVESVVSLVGILVSGLLSYVVVLGAGGIFLQLISEECLRRRGALPEALDWKATLGVILLGIRDSIRRLIYLLFFFAVMLLCSFFPPLLFIPVALNAFILGWDIVDTAQGSLNLPFKTRWSEVRAHRFEVLALGAVLSLALLIPLGGVLFLPPAYLLGAEKVAKWRSANDVSA